MLRTLDDVELLLDLMNQLYQHDGQTFDRPHARSATVQLIETPSAGKIWLLRSGGRFGRFTL